jgi:hypothetical protein
MALSRVQGDRQLMNSSFKAFEGTYIEAVLLS